MATNLGGRKRVPLGGEMGVDLAEDLGQYPNGGLRWCGMFMRYLA